MCLVTYFEPWTFLTDSFIYNVKGRERYLTAKHKIISQLSFVKL